MALLIKGLDTKKKKLFLKIPGRTTKKELYFFAASLNDYNKIIKITKMLSQKEQKTASLYMAFKSDSTDSYS